MGKRSEDRDSMIYAILSHPHRRRILELLRDKGPLTFKDLRRSLNLPVGTLYYHLDALGELVMQDVYRRYSLTREGRNLLGEFANRDLAKQHLAFAPPPQPFPLLRRLFSALYSHTLPTLSMALGLAILGGLLLSRSGLEPLLLFLRSSTLEPRAILLQHLLSLLALYAITSSTSLLLYRRARGELNLLAGVILSYSPILLLPLLLVAQEALNLRLGFLKGIWPPRLLVLGGQALALILLTNAISSAKGLTLDRAAVVALLAALLSAALVYSYLPPPT